MKVRLGKPVLEQDDTHVRIALTGSPNQTVNV